MTARSILMTAPMVKALRAGRKSQTRRAVKPQPYKVEGGLPFLLPKSEATGRALTPLACPYGTVGSFLWVRETWAERSKHANHEPIGAAYTYRADWDPSTDRDVRDCKWRSPIFMPRVASRLTLALTEVRIERLQSISEEDARAEGLEAAGQPQESARAGYQRLWETINGTESWAANPWIWVLSFRVHDRNIDQLG